MQGVVAKAGSGLRLLTAHYLVLESSEYFEVLSDHSDVATKKVWAP